MGSIEEARNACDMLAALPAIQCCLSVGHQIANGVVQLASSGLVMLGLRVSLMLCVRVRALVFE